MAALIKDFSLPHFYRNVEYALNLVLRYVFKQNVTLERSVFLLLDAIAENSKRMFSLECIASLKMLRHGSA